MIFTGYTAAENNQTNMPKQEPTIRDVMSSLNVVHKELCGLNNKVAV